MKTILVCLLAFPLAACTPPDAPNGDAAAPAAAPAAATDCPWNYENTRWWELCPPQYALCKDGKQQSPIDLTMTEPDDLPELEFHYRRAIFDVAPYYFDQELQAHPRHGDDPLSLSIDG
ncbi:MAG TPA: hypothetical protein VF121_09835, partial [Thermoanaerobaculia bacterium]|nr:hypothetical protein [Thermoanaerobaculia bacterium]